MDFRVLGPVEVTDGGRRVALGGPQPEKALAALLLAGGQVVTAGELVEVLWDADPPPTAPHQVHKVIAGLRRRIPGAIETDGPGYRIRLDGSTVDTVTFARLAAEGSVPTLTAALALWRGPALAGVDSRVLRARVVTLEEQRLAATERLVELRLAAGEAAAVAAELPALVAAHPLRETLRGQLMVALSRCGRPAEALAVYAQTRAVLAEELGVEPGPELAQLHARLLRADPALDPPAARAPCTLPYDLPDFAGRSDDLDRLQDTGNAVVITAIDGMAGIGKTALAVHAAHRIAPRYPDGQLFCDLHAHTPGARPVPAEVALERLLRMLGVPAESIPDGLDERAARWRAELAGRRVLVVLDNAESAAQVRPLLPGSPRCLALVTSRRRLGVVEGATVLSLDVLPPADAVALFAAVAGPDRAAAEPAATAEVVRLCGRLPLAIRIAATRLAHRPQWTVAALARRLRAGPGRLAELSLDDRGVGAAFALSYAQLEPAQRRLFRLLGLHPGAEIDSWSAAALAGCAPPVATGLLESLVDAHLLQPAPGAVEGRYTCHDLLREYAGRLAEAVPGAGRARRRLHDYYLAAATAATDLVAADARRFQPTCAAPPRHLPPLADLDAALGWLGAEHSTLVAVALATEDWQLACVLRVYFELRGHFADWQATHERALAAAAGDPRATALLRFNLGGLAMWTDRLGDAVEQLRLASDYAGDRQLQASALTSLGMVEHLAGRDTAATRDLRRALALDRSNPRTTALGWNNLALAEGRLGRAEAALTHHGRALALARQIRSESALRGILLGLGETSLRLRRPAAEPFREALELARARRFRMQEALALDGLAHATGDPGVLAGGAGDPGRPRRHRPGRAGPPAPEPAGHSLLRPVPGGAGARGRRRRPTGAGRGLTPVSPGSAAAATARARCPSRSSTCRRRAPSPWSPRRPRRTRRPGRPGSR